MITLAATFGVSVLSALVPLVNVEAYLVAVAATTTVPSLWLLALVAGAGQTVGKILWYEAARRALHWSWVDRRLGTPQAVARRDLWQARLVSRPWMSGSVLFASASVGLPPLLVMAVVAGQLQLPRLEFALIVLVGRTLRFAAVLGGLSWVLDLLGRSG